VEPDVEPEPTAERGEQKADVEPPAVEIESRTADEAEDLDATLIPLQNAALKDIKRALVDLQNDALEHLRTETDWSPKKSFTNKFAGPFSELAEAVSGSKDDEGAAKEFSADLHAAVSGAIAKARDSGAGDRQVASSVSRVFRMWRADESERRVLDAAHSFSSRI
jgi:hypothetical protein